MKTKLCKHITFRFFLWFVLKGKIIGNKSSTMENLKRKIANKNTAIPPIKHAATLTKMQRPPPPPPVPTKKEILVSTSFVTLSPAQVLVYICLVSCK
jgi:hypothetical protein